VWLLKHFCINPLVLILTSNFGICRFWINRLPCYTQHPHPLQMDYIYYKSNEQYLHYFIMKYLHNNFNKKCNIIFLYNYIAHFHEDPLVHKSVYLCRYCKLLIFSCLCWVFHKAFQIVIPTYQPTHVHVPLP